MNFTKIARQEAASFWEGSFEHPFITALADGNLAPEFFAIIYFRIAIILNILASFII